MKRCIVESTKTNVAVLLQSQSQNVTHDIVNKIIEK